MTPQETGSGDFDDDDMPQLSKECVTDDTALEFPESSRSPEDMDEEEPAELEMFEKSGDDGAETEEEEAEEERKAKDRGDRVDRQSRERAPSPEFSTSPSLFGEASDDGPSPKPDILAGLGSSSPIDQSFENANMAENLREFFMKALSPDTDSDSIVRPCSSNHIYEKEFEVECGGENTNRKLANIGNSCYMNATLQALAACPLFMQKARKYHNMNKNRDAYLKAGKDQEIVDRCTAILNHISQRTNFFDDLGMLTVGSQSLTNFRTCFAKRHLDFDNADQHDAHEFLTLLLGSFDEALIESGLRINTGRLRRIQDLQAASVFNLTSEECFQCIACGHETFLNAKTNHLSLGIRPFSSVQELVKRLYYCSTVEKKCSREGCDGQEARSCSRVCQFPQCLILHLQRYVFSMSGVSKKNYYVETEMELNMGTFGDFAEDYTTRRVEPAVVSREPTESPECPLIVVPLPSGIAHLFRSRTPQLPENSPTPEPLEHSEDNFNNNNKDAEKVDEEDLVDTSSETSEVQDECDVPKSPEKPLGFNPLRTIDDIKRLCATLNLEYHDDIIQSHLACFSESYVVLDKDTIPDKFGYIGGAKDTFYRSISWWLSATELFYEAVRNAVDGFLVALADSSDLVELSYHGSDLGNTRKNEVISDLERFALATYLNVELYIREENQWYMYTPHKVNKGELLTKTSGAIYLEKDSYGDFSPVTSVYQKKRKRIPVIPSDDEDSDSDESSPKRIKLENPTGESKSESENLNENESNKRIEYSLVAAVCHSGYSPSYGHYVAYTKDEDTGNWFRCSDETIEWVEETEMMNVICREGYVLYYVQS